MDRLQEPPEPIRCICYVGFGARGYSTTSLLSPLQKEGKGKKAMSTEAKAMRKITQWR
jgi:hypothetical protein